VLSGVRLRIKKLVEAQGIPLEKWDIQISRGIITGFNEAYYLSAEQRIRNRLLRLTADSPNSVSAWIF